MKYKIGNVIFHNHTGVLKIGYILDITDGWYIINILNEDSWATSWNADYSSYNLLLYGDPVYEI